MERPPSHIVKEQCEVSRHQTPAVGMIKLLQYIGKTGKETIHVLGVKDLDTVPMQATHVYSEAIALTCALFRYGRAFGIIIPFLVSSGALRGCSQRSGIIGRVGKFLFRL